MMGTIDYDLAFMTMFHVMKIHAPPILALAKMVISLTTKS
jgi:hypothetical protein